jgi:hypothetical protein
MTALCQENQAEAEERQSWFHPREHGMEHWPATRVKVQSEP